jgi:hypothetical protein
LRSPVKRGENIMSLRMKPSNSSLASMRHAPPPARGDLG